MQLRSILRPLWAAIFAVLAMASAIPAQADEPEIFVQKGGIFSKAWDYALNGYDTVAYHTMGKPVEGSDAFVTEFKGAKWRFASQDNLDAFIADPDAYRPQYGGYCAWAIAQNKLAKGDPKYWNIRDGKLYLNYDKSIQKKWLKDPDGFIAKANQIWPGILSE